MEATRGTQFSKIPDSKTELNGNLAEPISPGREGSSLTTSRKSVSSFSPTVLYFFISESNFFLPFDSSLTTLKCLGNEVQGHLQN